MLGMSPLGATSVRPRFGNYRADAAKLIKLGETQEKVAEMLKKHNIAGKFSLRTTKILGTDNQTKDVFQYDYAGPMSGKADAFGAINAAFAELGATKVNDWMEYSTEYTTTYHQIEPNIYLQATCSPRGGACRI